MISARPILVSMLLFASVLVSSASVVGLIGNEAHEWGSVFSADTSLVEEATRSCGGGLVGDCIDEEEEMEMGSEVSRRGLAAAGAKGSRYISYGALSKDRIPCNRRGQSYYNCRKNQRVNPYHRGCSAITRCARNRY